MDNDHAASPPRWRVLVVFGGLLLVMALAALDQTVVATALPTVVGDLGGVDQLSWVVTAYLLASTATVILWGRLGDLYGRHRLLMVSVVIFLAGSALCGAAWDMPALIGSRALQGIGAGGMMSLAMAMVADLVPPRERGRFQGYIQAMFAGASVAGPLLGGFFTDHLSWRWAFYINLPLGLAGLAVIGVAFRVPVRRVAHRIDYFGAALMVAGVSALQLVVLWGGSRYTWDSATIVGLGVLSMALLGLFVWSQARAAEPVLPLPLFRNPVFSVVSVALLAATCSLFAAMTFLPVYLQLVRGQTATNSGLLLLPLMIGITASTTVAGRVISATGRYKAFPVAGMALTALALALFATLGTGTSWPVVIGLMALMGAGFGMVTQVLVLAVQNTVDRTKLGTVTASANFFRSLGGSLGVAVFGAVLSAGLERGLPRTAGGTDGLIDTPARVAALPPQVRDAVAVAVARSLHDVFLVAAPIAALGLVAVLFLKEVPLRVGPPGGAPPKAAGGAAAGAARPAGALTERSPAAYQNGGRPA